MSAGAADHPAPDPPRMTPLRSLEVAHHALPREVAHPRPFIAELRVTEAHLSRAIPHVSNIEYVRWLDRVAELHSDAWGYPRQRMLDENIMWFVGRHEIDYRAEAWLDDRLLLITWVRDAEKVRSWRQTLIWRPADERIICAAATLWVLVDLAMRRPRRIPKEMRDRLDPLVTASSTGAATSAKDGE